MNTTAGHRYTLDQAAAELARRTCAHHGHDLATLMVNADPVQLRCTRCGKSWTVTPDQPTHNTQERT